MTAALHRQSRRLGELLVERHVLSRDTLETALADAASTGTPLASLLLDRGAVAEKDVLAAGAAGEGRRFVDLTEVPLQPAAATAIPAKVARRHRALGVAYEGDRLVVAFADPADGAAVSAVASAAGTEVEAAQGAPEEIARVLEAVYGSGSGAGTRGGVTAVVGAGDGAVHEIRDFLEQVVELGGSDLHLSAGSPPLARVNGRLRPIEPFPALNGSQIRDALFAILTDRQRERFERERELDASYSIPGLGRFRVNVFLQRDAVASVMRVIPQDVRPFEQLGLPAPVARFAELVRGLVLVTGPTGSGKSTTLASLIDIVNSTKPIHIMTVEDPIEFLHGNKQALVNQREVGEDTDSFAIALKHVLRQDPDVILVGEMRDLETISTALTAAETGHLVFATLHTQDAPQSIDRVIDVFPAHQQQQVRVQLASSLMGVVTQQLVPTGDGTGRAIAAEVLVVTPAVRNLIREGKVHQISAAMQTGAQHGMQTMDQSLAALVRSGRVALEVALEHAANPDDVQRLAGRR